MRRLYFRSVAEDAFSLASPEQLESIFQQLALPRVWAVIKEKQAEIGNHACATLVRQELKANSVSSSTKRAQRILGLDAQAP